MPFTSTLEQANEEVTKIISDSLDKGLSPAASISLGDVRRLMILTWLRGYSACEENSNATR